MTDTPTVEQLRSDVFAILRRHDVSEQCFAEVAMVTHAFRTQQPRPDANVDGLAGELEEYAGEFGSQQTGALPPELRDRILAVLTTREAVVEEVDLGAINALRLCQQQLDEDGVFVGVSRQALDQLLDWFDRVTEDAAAAIRALAAKEVE